VDNCGELIPEYLNFLKGIVNSDNFPLTISHEQLQQNCIIKLIKKDIIKKALEFFNIIAKKKEISKHYMSNFLKYQVWYQ
jgi:molecular chaperone HtpG